MAAKKSVEKMSYEEAFSELDEIVEQLESGELSLEDSLRLFERGQELGRYCSQLLEKAELTLKKLTQDENGELAEVAFRSQEE